MTNSTVFTVVQWRDRFVLVPMTEEEWFRKVLGDKEFDRRAEAARAKLDEKASAVTLSWWL